VQTQVFFFLHSYALWRQIKAEPFSLPLMGAIAAALFACISLTWTSLFVAFLLDQSNTSASAIAWAFSSRRYSLWAAPAYLLNVMSLANCTFFLLNDQKMIYFVVMSFPETHDTLVFRVAAKGDERAWRQFLSDYWLPVCRFAQQRANLGVEDAEDVASETFVAILRNQLLQRWVANRSAKLRTLLCTVVRHILSKRARLQKGRRRLLGENLRELLGRTDLPTIKVVDKGVEHIEEFYAAWVESILLQALESLMREYEHRGKVDYFRVLHRRVCEKMTAPQVSRALGAMKNPIR
jgi:DNA-directed RNA polymerase specialized sigma24 family protein